MIPYLSIFALLPGLISDVEGIFHAFPGSGSIKKTVVVNAVTDIVNSANTLGAKIDTAFVNSTLGQLIDNYVAVQNALGTAGFSAAQAAANVADSQKVA